MHWTRVPTEGSEAKLGSGKLELERSFTPQQPENVVTRSSAATPRPRSSASSPPAASRSTRRSSRRTSRPSCPRTG